MFDDTMTQLPKKVFYIICGLLLARGTLGDPYKPGDTTDLKNALKDKCAGGGPSLGPVSDFDLSDLTDLDSLEIPDNCNAELAGIGSWNTGTIKSMYETFYLAKAFNQDISGWDVSAVETLEDTFYEAEAFNQDISGWDVRKVETLEGTFSYAEAFNQDISGWDVSAVETLEETFYGAKAFSHKLCWDISAVTNTVDTLYDTSLSASIHQLGSAACAKCGSIGQTLATIAECCRDPTCAPSYDAWACIDALEASSATSSTVVSTVGVLGAVLAAAAALA